MDQLQNRLGLHDVLTEILGSEENVYFQPPESIRLEYPAIVYSLQNLETKHAGNRPYSMDARYQVAYIDRDPDSDKIRQLAMLPKCRHERHFKADNLNHYIFIIYF